MAFFALAIEIPAQIQWSQCPSMFTGSQQAVRTCIKCEQYKKYQHTIYLYINHGCDSLRVYWSLPPSHPHTHTHTHTHTPSKSFTAPPSVSLLLLLTREPTLELDLETLSALPRVFLHPIASLHVPFFVSVSLPQLPSSSALFLPEHA